MIKNQRQALEELKIDQLIFQMDFFTQSKTIAQQEFLFKVADLQSHNILTFVEIDKVIGVIRK